MPIQMVVWSVVAGMQAFMSGRASFWTCRFLLGILEGGFVPDMVLYLSYWYTSVELPRRLAFFWVAMQGTNIVSAVSVPRACHCALLTQARNAVPCVWYPPHGRHWRKSWMVMALCARR